MIKNNDYDFEELIEQFLKLEHTPKSFKEIWKVISKDFNVDEKEEKALIGDCYVELTLSRKFIFLGNPKTDLWNLKSCYSLKELKKLEKRNVFYNAAKTTIDSKSEPKKKS